MVTNIKEELWDSINKGLVINADVIEDSTNKLSPLLISMHSICCDIQNDIQPPSSILISVLCILRE